MNGTKIQTILAISAGSLLLSVSYLGFAWADTGHNSASDAQIKATNAIKNDPGMMKILNSIELFKQQYAAQQQKQTLQDQQQQLIDQQRKLANDYLQADLANLNNINNMNSPANAYSGFVSRVNSSTQGVFQDEFAYMQAKAAEGKLAMSKVLQNGGSRDEALNAYYGGAAT
ncbi:MAG: hypothetical protein ACREAT_01095, partial [Nitrosotalea sp.]